MKLKRIICEAVLKNIIINMHNTRIRLSVDKIDASIILQTEKAFGFVSSFYDTPVWIPKWKVAWDPTDLRKIKQLGAKFENPKYKDYHIICWIVLFSNKRAGYATVLDVAKNDIKKALPSWIKIKSTFTAGDINSIEKKYNSYSKKTKIK